jgi:hypothetical protein
VPSGENEKALLELPQHLSGDDKGRSIVATFTGVVGGGKNLAIYLSNDGFTVIARPFR